MLRSRAIWRLELSCSHTAFALAGEVHDIGKVFECHGCGGESPMLRVIVSSERSSFKTSSTAVRKPLR